MAKSTRKSTKPEAEAADQNSTGINIRTITPEPAEEIYVDGIGNLFFRGGVVKLNCYRVVGSDSEQNEEVRHHSHKLVMPTTALPDLIRLLQNAMNMSRQQQSEDSPTPET